MLPEDGLTLAYVRLTQAALDAMNGSVGGTDHEAAVQQYQEALGDWNECLKGVL
jgi:hypothetical protein